MFFERQLHCVDLTEWSGVEAVYIGALVIIFNIESWRKRELPRNTMELLIETVQFKAHNTFAPLSLRNGGQESRINTRVLMQ